MNSLIQHFEAHFQPQNPEFRINPENFHPRSLDKPLSCSYSYELHSSHFFYPVNQQLSSCIHVFSINGKTATILISWLHNKPADLDLHCFLRWVNLLSVEQELKPLFLFLSVIHARNVRTLEHLVARSV